MIHFQSDSRNPNEILDLSVSKELKEASARLCNLKLLMDGQSRKLMGQPFINDWMNQGGTCAFWGHTFLRMIVPFLDWEGEGRKFDAWVDPKYVLGASINGHPEHITGKYVDDKTKHYLNPSPTSNKALYTWYKPLGILSAVEGKHRVAFMRSHGHDKVFAEITETNYPDALRLKLIRPTDDNDDWLAILDDRFIQVIQRPFVTRHYLQIYGVAEVNWSSLSGIPEESEVRLAIFNRKLHKPTTTNRESDRTLDIHEFIKSDEPHTMKDIPETLIGIFNISSYKFQWLRFMSALIVCLSSALILGVLSLPWSQTLSNVLIGVVFGLVVSLNIIQFRSTN